MQIEEQDDEPQEPQGCFCCCKCCRKETSNPDLKRRGHDHSILIKRPYLEEGYLIPASQRKFNGKTLEWLRSSNPVTKNLPKPEVAIMRTNRKTDQEETSTTGSVKMDVSDVNNLLRRRLSLRLLFTEDEGGERGEAILPQRSQFNEAAPILLSHLVRSSTEASKSSIKLDTNRQSRSSFTIPKSSMDDLVALDDSGMEHKSDKEFLEYLISTSQFMKAALEKDWAKTRNYVKWVENYTKSPKFAEKAQKSSERWMVLLYTSSEDTHDQLTNFRCMLVRLLLQQHCVVYEERDITQPQFRQEFYDRLLGDKQNIPQVFMQGFNIGGYRVMYAIHKLNLTNNIFEKFILSKEGYTEWMFKKESKTAQLSLDVNLKAFPALQALSGSWANDKLSPSHLEFVTLGKFVVSHARERWYIMSSRQYTEPDLRRYALLRLTIIQALSAMNKIYKRYLNKIEPDGTSTKLRRKLSWLPKFSKMVPSD